MTACTHARVVAYAQRTIRPFCHSFSLVGTDGTGSAVVTFTVCVRAASRPILHVLGSQGRTPARSCGCTGCARCYTLDPGIGASSWCGGTPHRRPGSRMQVMGCGAAYAINHAPVGLAVELLTCCRACAECLEMCRDMLPPNMVRAWSVLFAHACFESEKLDEAVDRLSLAALRRCLRRFGAFKFFTVSYIGRCVAAQTDGATMWFRRVWAAKHHARASA